MNVMSDENLQSLAATTRAIFFYHPPQNRRGNPHRWLGKNKKKRLFKKCHAPRGESAFLRERELLAGRNVEPFSSLRVDWQMRNQGTPSTPGAGGWGGERKGEVNEKGGNLLILSFLRPFPPRKKTQSRGYHLTQDLQVLSAWLWRSNNAAATCARTHTHTSTLKRKQSGVRVLFQGKKKKKVSSVQSTFWSEHIVSIQDSRNSRSLISAICIPASHEAGRERWRGGREVFDFSSQIFAEKCWDPDISAIIARYAPTVSLDLHDFKGPARVLGEFKLFAGKFAANNINVNSNFLILCPLMAAVTSRLKKNKKTKRLKLAEDSRFCPPPLKGGATWWPLVAVLTPLPQ